jgi:hypothetical protein
VPDPGAAIEPEAGDPHHPELDRQHIPSLAGGVIGRGAVYGCHHLVAPADHCTLRRQGGALFISPRGGSVVTAPAGVWTRMFPVWELHDVAKCSGIVIRTTRFGVLNDSQGNGMRANGARH